MNPFDEAFSDIDYTDPEARQERLLGAILDNARRSSANRKPGQKRITLSQALSGVDPETTGVDPAPKKTDLNAKARAWLKRNGYTGFRVDYFDARFNRSHDLLEIFDYLGLKTGETVGVQVSSKSNRSARRKKLLSAHAFPLVKAAGWKVLLLTFDERGADAEWL